MNNILSYFNADETVKMHSLSKSIKSEIESGKIPENEYENLITYLNDVNVKNNFFRETTDVIFTKIEVIVDNRKTIKVESDKVIGGHWTCNCDVYVEKYEEVDAPNPNFGKKHYYILAKAKFPGMKNYRKFYL